MISRDHEIQVEIIDGSTLSPVDVRTGYATKYESEVVREFFNNKLFKFNGYWYPVNKVLAVKYIGVKEEK